MRVLLVLPAGTAATAGNRVTARRLAEGLAGCGVETRVAEADRLSGADLAGASLLHCFHAGRSAGYLLPLLEAHPVPVVITITGTDLEGAREDAESRQRVARSLARAAAVIVFHREAEMACRALFPQVAPRLRVVPQAPHRLPKAQGWRELRAQWGAGPADPIFLLAGGIRPVKDPLRALELLRPLAERLPGLRLVLAGPVLDADLDRELAARLSAAPFALYAGELEHEKMAACYRAADVVLNTSRSEGMPNALLEAMSLGRAVLAADIPGNRSVVTDGVDGLLFGPHDFLPRAEALARDPALRRKLGRRAAASVRRRFSRRAELAAHLEIYRQALAVGP